MQETQETQVWSLGQEDPLEEERAAHFSILAWEIHGQRSLAGYSQSMGLPRVRHDWATEHTAIIKDIQDNIFIESRKIKFTTWLNKEKNFKLNFNDIFGNNKKERIINTLILVFPHLPFVRLSLILKYSHQVRRRRSLKHKVTAADSAITLMISSAHPAVIHLIDTDIELRVSEASTMSNHKTAFPKIGRQDNITLKLYAQLAISTNPRRKGLILINKIFYNTLI